MEPWEMSNVLARVDSINSYVLATGAKSVQLKLGAAS
jgi:hypothetical protein